MSSSGSNGHKPLSPAFLRALADAEHYHHDQLRKKTAIPYFSHLMAVSSLVLEAGGTETEAIAALLHDAAEDAGGEAVLNAIRTNYGPEVATIVEECSDAMPAPDEKKEPWKERKEAYIRHLAFAGASALLVSAADKLHNLRAIYGDYLEIGDKIWDRFNAPKPKRDNTLWYYRSLYEMYSKSDSALDSRRTRLVTAIRELLDKLATE